MKHDAGKILLAKEIQLGGWEATERVEIVRSLHGDIPSFVYASIAIVVGASMTAIQTGEPALWVVAGVNVMLAIIRVWTMLLVQKLASRPDFKVVFWERLYLVLGTIHVACVGAWCTTVFAVGGGAFSQVVSFGTTIGYLIGIQARNFPSPLIARIQTVAAGVPMVCGLLLQGTNWYSAYAFILVLFFAGILRTNGRICDTFLGALRSARMNEELALFDTLTHLPNRAYMTRRLEEMTQDGQRPFALHFIDLDRFKRINDTMGHSAGDAILIEAAKRFKHASRDNDFISRFAGDEFLIIQLDADADGAGRFAERLMEAINEPLLVQGMPMAISCSIGTALYPSQALTADLLTRQADTALYQAKNSGRAMSRLFSADMMDRETNRLRIETDLKAALKAKEFRLFFQPLVEPSSLRIETCEALIRWQTADGKLILPGEFIGIAEETGLMDALSDWTLSEALRIAGEWPTTVRVAVNLSPSQLLRPKIVEIISQALKNAHIGAERLEIEITENLLLGEHHSVINKLDALRRMGVTVALDDFGTGYSNFSYIARLPIDKVKIDRSFLQGITEDDRRQSLLRGFIQLLGSLNFKTVVEGVETVEILQFLTNGSKIDQIQGFVFGRPLPASAITTLLSTGLHQYVGKKRLHSLCTDGIA